MLLTFISIQPWLRWLFLLHSWELHLYVLRWELQPPPASLSISSSCKLFIFCIIPDLTEAESSQSTADEDYSAHQNDQKDGSIKWEWNGKSNNFQLNCSAYLENCCIKFPATNPQFSLELWAPQTKQTNRPKKPTLDETTRKLTPRSSKTITASQLAFAVEEASALQKDSCSHYSVVSVFQYCSRITEPVGFAFPDQTYT